MLEIFSSSPNRDFMTEPCIGAGARSVLHKILSLQGAGRDVRRSSEARLGAEREEANGCNCGVVNRAGGGISWGPGEEGVAWCPERVVGILGRDRCGSCQQEREFAERTGMFRGV